MARTSYDEMERFVKSHPENKYIVVDFSEGDKNRIIRDIYDALGYEYQNCSLNYDALYDILTDRGFWSNSIQDKNLYLYIVGDHLFTKRGIFISIFTKVSQEDKMYVLFVEEHKED